MPPIMHHMPEFGPVFGPLVEAVLLRYESLVAALQYIIIAAPSAAAASVPYKCGLSSLAEIGVPACFGSFALLALAAVGFALAVAAEGRMRSAMDRCG